MQSLTESENLLGRFRMAFGKEVPDDCNLDIDADAMRRLQGGDDIAFNEIIERWRKRLIGYLLRSVDSRHDAEDIAQETFVRVYRYKDRYKLERKFSTWLFAIATNLVKNHYRWRRRHPEKLVRKEPGGEYHDETIERNEEADQVISAVRTLPGKMQSAVLLYYFDDMPQSEIAEVLSVSEKAVESLLYRARKQLSVELLSID